MEKIKPRPQEFLKGKGMARLMEYLLKLVSIDVQKKAEKERKQKPS